MNEPRTTDPELMEMYLEAEAQFGDDYFWTKHGHAAFLAERRTFTGPWQRCPLCGEYFGMDLHNGPCSDCDPNR